MEHGHQELETARPVADQEHHADKVEYAHEHARHVQELKEEENPLKTVQRLTLSWLRMTQLSLGKPCSIGIRNCKQPDQWPTSSIKNIRLTI